jgi:uncharacterized membrane protein
MEQRAPATSRSHRSTKFLIRLNRGIYHAARHWLLIANLLAAPFAILPILAPLLVASGNAGLARPIYALFAPLCHQQDDRSFHLLGEKTACCHRCLAVYGGLFGFGLLYMALRRKLPPASIALVSLLSTPIIADVLTQPALQRDSNLELRVTTGILFALAVSWAVLPRLEREFGNMARRIEGRFTLLVAQGRARPLLNSDASTPSHGRI